MDLNKQFQSLFNTPASINVFAPGRVNLIGEHTDYNLGLVLPSPIAQRTTVLMTKRKDQIARLHALGQTQQYTLGQEKRLANWLDYPQAITQELQQSGHNIAGFDALIESDVPLGSGLSSSAALLVALLRAMRQLFNLALDDLEIAKHAQQAENGLVGAHVGLLDQMACSLCQPGEALFINFRNMKYQTVVLPKNFELVILHSGLTHSHANDAGTRNYKTRRAECERAAKLLNVECLSDLGPEDLTKIAELPAPLAGRARHIVTENARVLTAVEALRQEDTNTLGQLFYQSHVSMRDDYDVSEPEIDLIVELAQKDPRIFGARLTGGGFGGSVVMLAKPGMGHAASQDLAEKYALQTGKTPKILT